MEPEHQGSSAPEESSPLSPADRRRVTRAAALRPLNVIVIVIGVGIFATTLAWWVPPLTLVTYALLVLLSARGDPIFARRVLHGREDARLPAATADSVVSRRVVVAIEESDDVTRAVLDDAVPKLHVAANQLVDVAQRREQVAEVLSDLRQPAARRTGEADVAVLQDRIRTADAEISDTFQKLLALRSRVVRVSIDSGEPEGAAALNASLDDLNT